MEPLDVRQLPGTDSPKQKMQIKGSSLELSTEGAQAKDTRVLRISDIYITYL